MSDNNLPEMIQIGSANIHEAERVQSLLLANNIAVEIAIPPPDRCSSGACGISAEIWVPAASIPAVQALFEAQRQKSMSGLEFDPEIINQVFDDSHEFAICPACGANFKTSAGQCHDCGLVFVGP